MNERILSISRPYITADGETSRLCADISWKEKKFTLWYGVEKQFEKQLCTERADAFIAACLPLAMEIPCDILSECEISERLYYQLSQYYIPTLAKNIDRFHAICVHAPLSADALPSAGAVMTGFSGGVDAMYTVQQHIGGKLLHYSLTHLAVFNVGAFEGSHFRDTFKTACNHVRKFSAEMDLEFISIDSNIMECMEQNFQMVCLFRNLSAALALQKLFAIYLSSSAYDFSSFSFDPIDMASYDLLTATCFSTENLMVYSAGGAISRGEKTISLAGFPPSYHWLHPCVYKTAGEMNCGICKKCIRTGLALYASGKLELYREVFPVDAFLRNLDRHIAYCLAHRSDILLNDVLSLLEKNDIAISPAARRYTRVLLIKKRLRKHKILRELWRILRKNKSFRDCLQ